MTEQQIKDLIKKKIELLKSVGHTSKDACAIIYKSVQLIKAGKKSFTDLL